MAVSPTNLDMAAAIEKLNKIMREKMGEKGISNLGNTERLNNLDHKNLYAAWDIMVFSRMVLPEGTNLKCTGCETNIEEEFCIREVYMPQNNAPSDKITERYYCIKCALKLIKSSLDTFHKRRKTALATIAKFYEEEYNILEQYRDRLIKIDGLLDGSKKPQPTKKRGTRKKKGE